jgi:hypothetical protein
MDKYRSDAIIRWKTARCLSAFKCNESIEVLSEICTKESDPVIRQEISRSLKIIKRRLAEFND